MNIIIPQIEFEIIIYKIILDISQLIRKIEY